MHNNNNNNYRDNIILIFILTYSTIFRSSFFQIIEGFTNTANNNIHGSFSNLNIANIKTKTTFLKLSSSNNENNDNGIDEIVDNNYAVYYAPTVIEKDKDETEEGYEDDDNNESSSNTNEYSFFDEATIYIRAGSGGQGSPSYTKIGASNRQKGVGDGGNGGKGGDIYLIVDTNLNNLAKFNVQSQRVNAYGGGGGAAKKFKRKKNWLFSMSFRSENGNDGSNRNRDGKSADDVYVRVPPGTLVEELILTNNDNNSAGDNNDEYTTITIGTIDNEKTSKLLAGKGGDGGEGTGVRAENSNRKRGGIRVIQASPTKGQRRILKLTLQILADVALVGVPNAGKSTLLASVTKAKPKIANYPFTTVIPNLGVWVPKNFNSIDDDTNDASLVLCDVPGLIRGASKGTGLGHAFLRHLERCHVILHIIDSTSIDPIHDYNMLNNELIHYKNGLLSTMPQVVIINKIDVFDDTNKNTNAYNNTAEDGLVPRKTLNEITNELKNVMPHSRIMYISAKENNGVEDLMYKLYGFVQKVKIGMEK